MKIPYITKQESPTQVYDKILNSISDNATPIEKARFIYLALGQYFTYDSRFLIASELEQKDIFGKDMSNIFNNKIVCSSLSQIYVKMLKYVGIEARTVYLEGKKLGHAFTEIKIGNEKYFANLVGDLMDIKIGRKTTEFMQKQIETTNFCSKYGIVSDSKLKEIDDKIGYTYNGLYFDDYELLMRKEFEKVSLRKNIINTKTQKDLCKWKIDLLIKYMKYDILNVLEQKDYIESTIKNCLSENEIEKYFKPMLVTCVRDDSHLEILFILSDKETGGKTVYKLLNYQKVEEVSLEKINDEFKNGLSFFSKHKTQDFNKLLSLENSKIQGSENIKVYTNKIDFDNDLYIDL